MEAAATHHSGGNSSLVPGVAVALAIGAGAVANFAGSGDNGGVGPFLVGAAVCLAIAAFLFLRIVPRHEGSARASWILAVLTVLSLGAFWSGAPVVFAAATIMVALPEPRPAARTAALAVAGLAGLAGLVVAVIG